MSCVEKTMHASFCCFCTFALLTTKLTRCGNSEGIKISLSQSGFDLKFQLQLYIQTGCMYIAC